MSLSPVSSGIPFGCHPPGCLHPQDEQSCLGGADRNGRRLDDAGFAWQKIDYHQTALPSPTQQVTSGLVGTSLKLFYFDRTTLVVKANLFPAVSDPGRVHFNLNASYYIELWGQLNWNFTFYGNWDSRPPPGFSTSDYGTTSGISWSFGNH